MNYIDNYGEYAAIPESFLVRKTAARSRRLIRVGRQFETLLTAEQLRQHLDPVARQAPAGSLDGFSLGFGRSHMVRPASPRPRDRMVRVERPPIEADIGTETARLDEPLGAVMTPLAQRLKRPTPKLVEIAMMRLDVIASLARQCQSRRSTCTTDARAIGAGGFAASAPKSKGHSKPSACRASP